MAKKEIAKKGFVYVMTNPSFRDDWVKIGYTDNLKRRLHELSHTTAIPLPFELYAYVETAKYQELEKNLHRSIELISTELDENNNLRINPNKEFFNITPQHAYELLRNALLLLGDANITLCKSTEEEQSNSTDENATKDERTWWQKSEMYHTNTTFAFLSIPVGSEIIFAGNNTITATTTDKENHIRLSNDNVYTITRATQILNDKFDLWGDRKTHATNGFKNWMYQGEILYHIRERIIKEQLRNQKEMGEAK